jgi:hypothetical protein
MLLLAPLVLAALPALAGEPKPPDPIIQEVANSLSPDGIKDRQLQAIRALADAYEREKARADAAEAKLKESEKVH